MEYASINTESMVNGYRARIAQLEGEHFTNTVLIFEAEVTGSENTEEAQELVERNNVLEQRINALRDKVLKMSELSINSEGKNEPN